MSGSHHGDWEAEFDRKIAEGAPVDNGMRGEPRVQDDNGNWYTRDGAPCCGCGRNRNMGDERDQYGIPWGNPNTPPNAKPPKKHSRWW